MGSVITLNGIDQAISNLNYRNKNTLKYRLVHTMRQFYEDENSVELIDGIDTDKLIKLLWDTGNDPLIIKNKRKNLSSVKSSVNSDLKRLYENNKNPEGITIGSSNIFVMSDEAKDNILKSFGGDIPLEQISGILDILNEILSNPDAIKDEKNEDGLTKLDKLKRLLQDLAQLTEDYEELEAIAEDDETEEDIEEVEPEDDLEEVDIIEEPEDTDEVLDENEIEEDIEDAGTEDDLEEVEPEDVEEVIEDDETEEDIEEVEPEDDLEEVDIIEEPEDTDEILDEDDDNPEEIDESEKSRLLAEEFNNSLATMDKFHNQYILIPENVYIVGSMKHKNHEKPEQKIHLMPFYIGKFPVTNALFEIFIEKSGYKTTAEKLGYGTVYHGRYQKRVDEQTGLERFTWNTALVNETIQGACWYQPWGPGSTLHNKRNHPVVQVSIEDAMAFAAWTGKRLPTEDEWEAASRTCKGYIFPWGNDWKKDFCNTEESYNGDTTPMDKYIEFENDFGIVDPMGNVLEWTMDRIEPQSGKNNTGYNIVKGGSWVSRNDIYLFSRFKLEPESHSNILGFRCVAY